jgi:hypothetical protein
VSAAIHIHVILADINREDERFLLGARLHPSFLLTCKREGYFSPSSGRAGREAKTYGLITLARCQAIFLSCRPALGNRSSLCLPFALIYTMKTNAGFQCDHSSDQELEHIRPIPGGCVWCFFADLLRP